MGNTPPGWTQLYPPCLSIPGFLGYSDDPGIIPGWTQLTPPPPCLSILGFLGYSDGPGIIPGWIQLTPPLSEYPGIPGILGRSQDYPGMDGHSSTPPPCLSILGFLGYSDDPGIIPGWTQLTPPPCLSILGFLGYSDDPRIIPGWTQLTPPCLSILGFLGYSDDPGIIPGWTQLTTPLSEYPGIPGILGRSRDGHRSPLPRV